MIKVIENFTAPGSADRVNEDLIFVSPFCAAVLDGATNLNGSDYGANEFVSDFRDIFADKIQTLPLDRAINESIKALYSRKFDGAPPPEDIELYSSAAAAFALERNGKLYVTTLGDCTALVYTKDGKTHKIYDPALDALDGEVTAALAAMRENSGNACDVCELVKRPEIRKMLADNRKKMNKPNGYRSLSFDMLPLKEKDIAVFDITEIDRVRMYSDGFKSVETDIISGAKIHELFARLRDRENADRSLNARPRFKVSDDASFIEFSITE